MSSNSSNTKNNELAFRTISEGTTTESRSFIVILSLPDSFKNHPQYDHEFISLLNFIHRTLTGNNSITEPPNIARDGNQVYKHEELLGKIFNYNDTQIVLTFPDLVSNPELIHLFPYQFIRINKFIDKIEQYTINRLNLRLGIVEGLAPITTTETRIAETNRIIGVSAYLSSLFRLSSLTTNKTTTESGYVDHTTHNPKFVKMMSLNPEGEDLAQGTIILNSALIKAFRLILDRLNTDRSKSQDFEFMVARLHKNTRIRYTQIRGLTGNSKSNDAGRIEVVPILVLDKGCMNIFEEVFNIKNYEFKLPTLEQISYYSSIQYETPNQIQQYQTIDSVSSKEVLLLQIDFRESLKLMIEKQIEPSERYNAILNTVKAIEEKLRKIQTKPNFYQVRFTGDGVILALDVDEFQNRAFNIKTALKNVSEILSETMKPIFQSLANRDLNYFYRVMMDITQVNVAETGIGRVYYGKGFGQLSILEQHSKVLERKSSTNCSLLICGRQVTQEASNNAFIDASLNKMQVDSGQCSYIEIDKLIQLMYSISEQENRSREINAKTLR